MMTNARAEKLPESKNQSVPGSLNRPAEGKSALHLEDNRTISITQRKQIDAMTGGGPVQRRSNHTGLPGQIKTGIVVQLRMSFAEYEAAAKVIQQARSKAEAAYMTWKHDAEELADKNPQGHGVSNMNRPVVVFKYAIEKLINDIESKLISAGGQPDFRGPLQRMADNVIPDLEDYLKKENFTDDDMVKLDVDRVNRSKANGKGSNPAFLLQADYMSGDRFGVSTALLLNSNLNVIIIYNPEKDGDFKELTSFYKRFEGKSKGRIWGVAVNDPHAVYGESGLTVTKGTELVAEYQNTIQDPQKMITKRRYAATDFRKTHNIPDGNNLNDEQLSVKNRLASEVLFNDVDPKATIEKIHNFLKGVGISMDGSYAFVWTKYRNKNYDKGYALLKDKAQNKIQAKTRTRLKEVQAAMKQGQAAQIDPGDMGRLKALAKADTEKLYHFSSSSAWATLIHTIKSQTGRTPVLIGDKAEKLKGLVDINLSEFWDKIPQKEPGKVDRMDQLRFFSVLAHHYDVINIGMRSGGLEAPMLTGMKTIYLEEAGNTNPERMEKWLDAFPNYIRIILDAPLGGEGKRMNWAGDKKNKKDSRSILYKNIMAKLQGQKRNFSKDELTCITAALKTARPEQFTHLKNSFGRFSTMNLSHRAREAQLVLNSTQVVPAAKLIETEVSNLNRFITSLPKELALKLVDILKGYEGAQRNEILYERLRMLMALDPLLEILRSDISRELERNAPQTNVDNEETMGFDLFEKEPVDTGPPNEMTAQLLEVSKIINQLIVQLKIVKNDLGQLDNRSPYRTTQVQGGNIEQPGPKVTYDIVEYFRQGKPVTKEFYSIMESIIAGSLPDYAIPGNILKE